MQDTVREFGELLASSAIARDWSGVHGMLAPWLQERLGVESVKAFFEDDYRQMLQNNDVEGEHFPGVAQIDGNSSGLDYLRKTPSFKSSPRPIPSDVTEGNFRQWMNIQLQCTEEQAEQLNFDFFTDIWLIVVEIEGSLRVGYGSHDAY